MKNETILNAVNSYIKGDPVRFHMPGHKGRTFDETTNAIFGGILPYDVTELEETDDLLDAKGGYLASYERAARLYGTTATRYSTGGATLAIQTAIRLIGLSAQKNGRAPKILCDRRAHKSVVNAFALCGITPDWFFPWREDDTAFDGFDAVFITSPDYYGRMCDVSHYAEKCRRAGAKLIVDNSHGAHLAFYDGGRLHAYRLGADIVVDSLHKTLPAMTGAALLHLRDAFSAAEINSAMSLFSTTSPSYAIALSIDACLDYMSREGERLHSKLLETVERARRTLTDMGFALTSYPVCDPFRLCFLDRNAPQLYAWLRERGVVGEFCDRTHAVLLPSVMNSERDFERLIDACADFSPAPAEETMPETEIPRRAVPIRDAVFSGFEMIPVKLAEGRICAAPVSPYPPGIPLIMPGEVFSSGVCGLIRSYGINEVSATL